MGPPKKSPPPNRPGGTSVRRPRAADARDVRASPGGGAWGPWGLAAEWPWEKTCDYPLVICYIAIENGDL